MYALNKENYTHISHYGNSINNHHSNNNFSQNSIASSTRRPTSHAQNRHK